MKIENDINLEGHDEGIKCPLFLFSASRSITTICGVLFLSFDHQSFYIIPHQYVTLIRHTISTLDSANNTK